MAVQQMPEERKGDGTKLGVGKEGKGGQGRGEDRGRIE